MGIVKHRKTVGIERKGEAQRLFEGLQILVGKPVDKIDIDRDHVVFACQIHRRFGDIVRLDAVDGMLHFFVEILDAETHAVKTVLA